MNVTEEVCLTHTEGKEIGGRPEQQVMFDLADGRLMLVPKSVRDQIRKLGIKGGERFRICKRKVDDRAEECFEWTVNRNVGSQVPSTAQLIQSAKNGGPAPARP